MWDPALGRTGDKGLERESTLPSSAEGEQTCAVEVRPGVFLGISDSESVSWWPVEFGVLGIP